MKDFASLNQSYSLLNVVSTWAEVLNMYGMRWIADFVVSISSLQKPANLQRLNKDLMQVWIVILYGSHACVIGFMGRICAAVINAHLDRTGTEFVTSILASQFSATSENTKYAFCKLQIWFSIRGINSLFQ